MKRVLFIFDIVFYSTLCLWVVFVAFPGMKNRFASDIATEEIADGPIYIPLSELEGQGWCMFPSGPRSLEMVAETKVDK